MLGGVLGVFGIGMGICLAMSAPCGMSSGHEGTHTGDRSGSDGPENLGLCKDDGTLERECGIGGFECREKIMQTKSNGSDDPVKVSLQACNLNEGREHTKYET